MPVWRLHSFTTSIVAMLMSFAVAVAASMARAEPHSEPERIPSNAAEKYSPFGELALRTEALPSGPRVPVPEVAPVDAFERPVLLQQLKRRLDQTRPFIRDTELRLYARTYYFNQNNFDGTRSQAWAGGPVLWYESGLVDGRFQLGGAVATSQPLSAPKGEAGTLLLTNAQGQITTPKLAYARMRLLGHELTLGRQQLNTAYVNAHDNRMIPITFEGAVIASRKHLFDAIRFQSGFLWRFKPRDTSTFQPFSRGLKVTANRGLLINGLRLKPLQGLTVGAINHWTPDVLSTTYAELDWLLPLSSYGLSYRFGINYTDQRTVGQQLLAGAPYHTSQVSARLVFSRGRLTLTAAVSKNADDAPILSPFGAFPVFTDLDQADFERAGERAATVSVAYDFSELITQGLKFQIGYGVGRDAADGVSRAPLPDRSELDLKLDYQPKLARFENVRLQLYYALMTMPDHPRLRRQQPRFRAVLTYMASLL